MGVAQIKTAGCGMESTLGDADVRSVIINEGRSAVHRAFHHWALPKESPIAYFDGAHRPKQPRRSKSRPRTQVMHAVATRPSGYSKPNLVPGQQITGHTHRAIAELEPLQFLWIQYRYRPWGSARTAHGEHFQRDYFRRYAAEHLQGCKIGTRRLVRYLIAVAVDGGGKQDSGFLPLGYDLPAGIDINRRNWNKTYLPHWRRICLDITTIDNEALFEVGEKVGGSGPIA